jgi:hypothetical protein
MVKTFWRMRLHEALGKPILLSGIEVEAGLPTLVMTTWEGYWADVPEALRRSLRVLEVAWRAYIAAGSRTCEAHQYCAAYMALVREATREASRGGPDERTFLGRAVGFENFILKSGGASGAGTTNFRNPVFLSSSCLGLRKHARNDPSLLPLVVGCRQGVPRLFYHYGKQNLLRNTDRSLLFFPAVAQECRGGSFRCLQALTGSLTSEWDSRVHERSRLLADRVLVPLLTQGISDPARGVGGVVRVLDIGSGVGLFTSRVFARIARSGALGGRKIELSLLDILPVDPKRYFRSVALLANLARVEYLRREYVEWIGTAGLDRVGDYDIVLLCRILHNMSHFRIRRVGALPAGSCLPGERYRMFPHLSDYYHAIALLFPEMADGETKEIPSDCVFHPSRVFNPSALLTPDGTSLVEGLARVSGGVLIEDADLTPSALLSHVSQHAVDSTTVFDLSGALRLSVNHIYWITRSGDAVATGGAKLWPK